MFGKILVSGLMALLATMLIVILAWVGVSFYATAGQGALLVIGAVIILFLVAFALFFQALDE